MAALLSCLEALDTEWEKTQSLLRGDEDARPHVLFLVLRNRVAHLGDTSSSAWASERQLPSDDRL